MALHLPPMECFNCEGETNVVRSRWQKWKRALDIFLKAANIDKAENKRATLLHTGGVALQGVLYNIPGAMETENENENVYDLAIKKLDEYFSSRNNIIHERHLFKLIHQEDGEKFQTFLRKLREQVKNCKYTNAEDQIIDQIFENCNITELKRKMLLMQNEELKLDNIINEANALEAISRQLKDCKNKEKKGHIKKIKILQEKRKERKKCLRCGNINHDKNFINCPARHNKCMKCKFVGHYKHLCFTKNKQINTINKYYKM